MYPNFVLLDSAQPEIASMVSAMLQAREAVAHRSWAHPQEPTSEEWWADVLADRRARTRERRTAFAVNQAFYRLAHGKRQTIPRGCSQGGWRASVSRRQRFPPPRPAYPRPPPPPPPPPPRR